ncbi:MAG: hypothetical protein JO025_09115 [Verrucomicrobia bacterium]|nr:hypothetical protein [Verrucomicrobiota bacterium]
MDKIIPSLLLLVLPALGFSQTAPSPQLTEMKKLDFLVGRWKGSGYFEYSPGQRRNFTETETVQAKLDGLMALFEGEGKSNSEQGTEITVHSALALASYDDLAKAFKWHAYRADRGALSSIDTEATVGNNKLQWGFANPRGGMIRFTIELNDKGEWFEVGESSADAKTWQKFMEMTLVREP